MVTDEVSRSHCVRIDAHGGVAGDMFVAAAIDAVPALEADVDAALTALPLPTGTRWQVESGLDAGIQGRRLRVELPSGHTHSHRGYAEIRDMIGETQVVKGVRARALAIYGHLAEAEALVHGTPVEEVAFHEVGAWDSVIDVVAAAAAIEALQVDAWACGPLPLGRGIVRAAHGDLPVPAPAALELLTGFEMYDDGLDGERVTPTGAAILRHLQCGPSGGIAGRLVAAGTGLGTRQLSGKANTLRLLFMGSATEGSETNLETICQIACEIDDQPAEDLAVALERIRAMEGVVDVVQMPVYAKKGRLAIRVEALMRPDCANAVATAILSETSTLGVRLQDLRRLTVPRDEKPVASPRGEVQVKTATRPGGRITHKPAVEDVARLATDYQDRAELRRIVAKSADKPEHE